MRGMPPVFTSCRKLGNGCCVRTSEGRRHMHGRGTGTVVAAVPRSRPAGRRPWPAGQWRPATKPAMDGLSTYIDSSRCPSIRNGASMRTARTLVRPLASRVTTSGGTGAGGLCARPCEGGRSRQTSASWIRVRRFTAQIYVGSTKMTSGHSRRRTGSAGIKTSDSGTVSVNRLVHDPIADVFRHQMWEFKRRDCF